MSGHANYKSSAPFIFPFSDSSEDFCGAVWFALSFQCSWRVCYALGSLSVFHCFLLVRTLWGNYCFSYLYKWKKKMKLCKLPAQGHRTSASESSDLNPGYLDSQAICTQNWTDVTDCVLELSLWVEPHLTLSPQRNLRHKAKWLGVGAPKLHCLGVNPRSTA